MLYMIAMDENFQVAVPAEVSDAVVEWITIVGATSGMAIRIQFMAAVMGIEHPTIAQAIAAMAEPRWSLKEFVSHEDGAVLVWKEIEGEPLPVATHDGPLRRQ